MLLPHTRRQFLTRSPAALGALASLLAAARVPIDPSVERMHPAGDAAKRDFASVPEVQQCYYVTGEVDFMLVVVVPTMEAYEAFTRRMFFGNNNVKRFRTFVAMDRVKVGLSVPLPET